MPYGGSGGLFPWPELGHEMLCKLKHSPMVAEAGAISRSRRCYESY